MMATRKFAIMTHQDNKDLRKFCLTMSMAFVLFTIIIMLRHRHSIIPAYIVSFVFLVLSFFTPAFLRPIYTIWMKLAHLLGWVNTRLILFVLFYLVFTPTGLIMRLFKLDLLDRKMQKDKDSYWQKKERKEFNPLDYERQF